ncbi:MAG TPA: GNAT family N-acetyltransferase [Gemmatimonadaceae bacterium]|nr:GNAT family N-acetyltransferase [Gemmatimonadaceae bacterium]
MTEPDKTAPRWTIRAASAEDLAVVTALLRSAHLQPNALGAQFGPQFAVAVDAAGGTVIGAAGIEVYADAGTSVGLLRSAAVDDAWRGGGIGAALTDDRLQWAEDEGLSAVYLLTQTAAGYWPRFGFGVTARDAAPAALMASHEWRQGCPASAVAMRLALPRPRR